MPLRHTIEVSWFILLYAMRYTLGRRSTAPSDVADEVRSAWKALSPECRRILQRDLSAEIKRDDESRAAGSKYRPLGDDCDRATWLALRNWMADHT